MVVGEKRFAVLIDSDNISAKYISYILNELTKYGTITYKRIYGDWTSSRASKWKEKLLENSINPIQQFSNTVGKNATDSALIIDAMDILYSNNVEGFCIVSSDSDFTKLASRLRESGMSVIGMGENKTPQAFRAACTVFTNLEVLVDQEDDIEEDTEENRQENRKLRPCDKETNYVSKNLIEKDIADIIVQNENNGKITELGEIGSRLVKKYPDFDVRNYGYSLLSKFLEEMSNFTLKRNSNIVSVMLKDNTVLSENINNDIRIIVKQKLKKGILLSELSNRLHAKYKNFNVKDYGYSTFSKFVQNIKEVEIKDNNSNIKYVYYVGK